MRKSVNFCWFPPLQKKSSGILAQACVYICDCGHLGHPVISIFATALWRLGGSLFRGISLFHLSPAGKGGQSDCVGLYQGSVDLRTFGYDSRLSVICSHCASQAPVHFLQATLASGRPRVQYLRSDQSAAPPYLNADAFVIVDFEPVAVIDWVRAVDWVPDRPCETEFAFNQHHA